MKPATSNGDPRPDAAVIASINAGRREDFEVLYARYAAWVLRLARRVTGDDDLARDVLQETFVDLVRRLPALKLTGRLTTYLYAAVRHRSIDAARRRRRDAPGRTSPEGVPAAPAPVSEDPSAVERRAMLADALADLPGAQREVLLMRIVDEMSVREIAAALDVPEGTVKSRLHHALGTLREDPRTRGYFAG